MLIRVIGLALAVCLAVATADAVPAAPSIVRVNGVAMALERRVLRGAPAELLARLEGRWGERLPDAGSPAAGATRLHLGRQRGAFHETLTLSPGPGPRTSIALVAVQDLRRAPRRPAPPPFALPPGLQLVNVVEFGSFRGAPAAFTLDTGRSPQLAVGALAAAARASGWSIADVPRAGGWGDAAWARRLDAQLAIVAVRVGSRTRATLLVTSGSATVLP